MFKDNVKSGSLQKDKKKGRKNRPSKNSNLKY